MEAKTWQELKEGQPIKVKDLYTEQEKAENYRRLCKSIDEIEEFLREE